jgi:hypothetical protein
MSRTDEYRVPDSEPVYECEHCGRPFAREEWRALHRGLEHASHLDDEEVAQFRAAYEDEQESIRMFRLKALATLVVLYFTLLMIYAVI